MATNHTNQPKDFDWQPEEGTIRSKLTQLWCSRLSGKRGNQDFVQWKAVKWNGEVSTSHMTSLDKRAASPVWLLDLPTFIQHHWHHTYFINASTVWKHSLRTGDVSCYNQGTGLWNIVSSLKFRDRDGAISERMRAERSLLRRLRKQQSSLSQLRDDITVGFRVEIYSPTCIHKKTKNWTTQTLGHLLPMSCVSHLKVVSTIINYLIIIFKIKKTCFNYFPKLTK